MPFLLECRGWTFQYPNEPEAAAGTFRNFPTAVCQPTSDAETGECRLLVWATADLAKPPVACVRVYEQPAVFTASLWRLPS